MSDPQFNSEQAHALRATRWWWGLAVFVCAPLPFLVQPLADSSDWLERMPVAEESRAMTMALIAGAFAVFVGLFARNQAYKAGWRGEVVEPAAFTRGNMLFYAAVTVGALLIFAVALVSRFPAPSLTAAPIVLGLLVFNFPNGKPMLPAPPRIGEDEGTR